MGQFSSECLICCSLKGLVLISSVFWNLFTKAFILIKKVKYVLVLMGLCWSQWYTHHHTDRWFTDSHTIIMTPALRVLFVQHFCFSVSTRVSERARSGLIPELFQCVPWAHGAETVTYGPALSLSLCGFLSVSNHISNCLNNLKHTRVKNWFLKLSTSRLKMSVPLSLSLLELLHSRASD